MEGSPIDIVIFAPLAPILAVLLFWFIQLLFIESEKFLLTKIRPKHKPLCRFTNFLGILFQTICHAMGYTVTRSGISDFYISISYGKVAPKKQKKGLFEWIANGFLFVGPFFLPAFLLLICLFFLMSSGFEIVTPVQLFDVKYTFAGQIITFGTSLFTFSEGFFGFLFKIDLLHPSHLGFLILLIFFGMGMRPSYIGEERKEKVDMLYDLRNIWSLIRLKPLYLIILFLMSYIFFYISLFLNNNWYVALFSILGWVSIISIVALVITDVILLFIKTTDEIPGFWRYIPFITVPLSYFLFRVFFYFFRTKYTFTLSLVLMILITILIIYILLKFKTNKFKTSTGIKFFKKKRKGEKDEG
jgi:hypothetical protein